MSCWVLRSRVRGLRERCCAQTQAEKFSMSGAVRQRFSPISRRPTTQEWISTQNTSNMLRNFMAAEAASWSAMPPGIWQVKTQALTS